MAALRLVLLSALAAAAASANELVGLKFLEDNRGKEGVTTLPSGLQYKVLSTGDGDSWPTANSECECHYEGRTAQNYPSGETFDSSYKRGSPATFAPDQTIKGWTEAMQMMVEGDKWELYVPSELAYGEDGRPPIIGPGDVLVFTMEIVKILGGRVYFEGPKGEERKVRTVLANGYVQHWEGVRGEERAVRSVLPDGGVMHYEGPKGEERKVRGELADGSVVHLEGERGAERMVRIEKPDGAVEHYDGPKEAPRLVRTEYPDGRIIHDEV